MQRDQSQKKHTLLHCQFFSSDLALFTAMEEKNQYITTYYTPWMIFFCTPHFITKMDGQLKWKRDFQSPHTKIKQPPDVKSNNTIVMKRMNDQTGGYYHHKRKPIHRIKSPLLLLLQPPCAVEIIQVIMWTSPRCPQGIQFKQDAVIASNQLGVQCAFNP